MLTRNRRRSTRITLVLLGTAAALSACGDSDDGSRRDLYASKRDCVQDWGDETKCGAAPAGTTSSRPHTGGGYFWGPTYTTSGSRAGASSSSIGSTMARSGSRAIASSSFSRGGFGSSGSSHGSSST